MSAEEVTWSRFRPDRIQELADRLNNKEENE